MLLAVGANATADTSTPGLPYAGVWATGGFETSTAGRGNVCALCSGRGTGKKGSSSGMSPTCRAGPSPLRRRSVRTTLPARIARCSSTRLRSSRVPEACSIFHTSGPLVTAAPPER